MTLLVSGCAGTDPPLGGSTTPAAVTLTMAHFEADTGGDITPQWFMDSVEELSGGAMTIEFVGSCCGRGADSEQLLIDRVAEEDSDLGWVGTRAFSDAGVSSLAPLTAPFLLDGYAKQQAVLDSDVVPAMLADLADAGVIGVGLSPGLLRRPTASDAALVSLSDWAGVPFQVFPSTPSAEAIAALGAVPGQLPPDERNEALADRSLRGMENSILFQVQGRHVPEARITANVILWPRTSALIASSDVWTGLTLDQQTILVRAMDEVIARTMELRSEDERDALIACREGNRFATASEGDLTALRAAVEPVYSQLRSDATSASYLAEIEQLAAEAGADPALEIPADCAG